MSIPPVQNQATPIGGEQPHPGIGFEVSPVQGGAQVSFLKRGVQPPSDVYVLTDDLLGVLFVSDTLNGTVTVAGRLLEPSGRVSPFETTFQIFEAGVQIIRTVGLAEGFLLNVSALGSSLGNESGHTFVALAMGRGLGGSFLPLSLLAAGYVGDGLGVAFPGPVIRGARDGPGASVVTTMSGQGPSSTISVPSGCIWRPRSINGLLTTTAAAGNRQLSLTLFRAATRIYEYTHPATVPASSAINFSFTHGIGFEQATATNNMAVAGLPDLELFAGDQIAVTIAGYISPDTIGPPAIQVEQWVAASGF